MKFKWQAHTGQATTVILVQDSMLSSPIRDPSPGQLLSWKTITLKQFSNKEQDGRDTFFI